MSPIIFNNTLYSMMFDINPYSILLIDAVGIEPDDCLGKLCDTFVSDDGKKLYILSRNGGGTIDPTELEFKKKPTFVMKWIEQNDPTYVTYEFNIPEMVKDVDGNDFDLRARIVADIAPHWNVAKLDHRREVLGDLKARRKTPEIEALINRAKEIVRPIVKDWQGTTQIVEEGRAVTVERLGPLNTDNAKSDMKSDRNLG